MKKKIFSLILCAILVFTAGVVPVSAADVDDKDVFLKQPEGSDICTLAAATMMLRRQAILDGKSDWKNITVDTVGKIAWAPGLYKNFTYQGMKVTTQGLKTAGYTTTESKKSYFISMLQKHPEGIVIYNHSEPHAVLLTSYDASTDTFYCADSDPYFGTGIIKLKDSSIVGSSQNAMIGNINQIWYIKSTQASAPVLKTESETAGKWKVKVPANYKLYGYASSDSTSSYTYVAPGKDPYTISCTKKAVLSTGKVRYFFVSGDNKNVWFDFTSSMTVSEDKPEGIPGYQMIYNVSQLQNIRSDLSGKYALANDLDLSGVKFEPLGTEDDPFTGTFNGNGCTIRGFSLNAERDNAGLFGYVQGGTIQNVTVENASVKGDAVKNVAVLAGSVDKGTVSSCTVKGGKVSVSGNLSFNSVGGVIGTARNSLVTFCANSADVTGAEMVGGIVGQLNQAESDLSYCYNEGRITAAKGSAGGIIGTTTFASYNAESGSVKCCYNTGTIDSKQNAGGIVGHSNYSVIEDCGNTGRIEADSRAGGIAGIVVSGMVKNCFNKGTVSAAAEEGGLFGSIQREPDFENCYYDGRNSDFFGSTYKTENREGVFVLSSSSALTNALNNGRGMWKDGGTAPVLTGIDTIKQTLA